ncbi:hypothetical protein N9K14_02055 [Candidatus Pelagibacter ubique]|nr:hypothetical protein [Candidatus Pelagibacter ubique]
MKKIVLIFFVSLIWSNIITADEKEIIFINRDEAVNSYQAQAISFSLFEKISDTLQMYIQETHVPFMFETKDSKVKFLPDTPLSELLTFKAVSIDLNNDGIDEVITYVSGNLVCGSSGCSSYILQGKEKDWKIIGEYFPGANTIISSNKTNGFLDISYIGSKKYSCKFNGKIYQCD